MFIFPMPFNSELNTRLISVSQLLLLGLFDPCYSQDTKPHRLSLPCNLRDMAVFTSCMLALALFQFFHVLCFYALFSHAANSTIQQGHRIRDGETLVSNGLNFDLGFFSLTNSPSRYVGIWYHNVTIPTYVWVANREKPVQGRGGAITINNEGILVILDGENKEVWSSNVSTTSSNESEAVLSDDGNLVLSTKNGSSLWQSFENPTDTFLPGMQVPVGDGKRSHPGFTSWKSATDPSKGNYSMEVESGESPQIVIFDGERRKRWRSGYWDGRIFTGVSTMTGGALYGFKLNNDDEGGRYFVFVDNTNTGEKIRFKIDWDGYERMLRWNEDGKNWDETQSEPYNECEFYNYCGSFAVCDHSAKTMCDCLKGFKPRDKDQWDRGNWSEGCERRTPLKAESANNGSGTEGTVGEDGFFEENGVKLPDSAQIVNPGGTVSDCERTCLMNSSCTAYAQVIGIGCMIWHGELDDIQRLENLSGVLNIRLADADLGNGENKTKIWVISIVVVGLICLGIFAWLVWRYKGKLKAKKNNDILLTEAANSTDLSLELSESADVTLEGNQLNGPELPFFKFSSIAIATNNFSAENKLGQGGFGPVYKGILAGGEETAVKRLSTRSCQGLVEFKNEMMLIAKLQHRNLVRLMGYSIEGEEKLLLYEYLPNKSLDCFLFDLVKKTQLDWTRRFEIIEGIARGLLYLHRDSRLRIIHRDLKASNILLDENMNPKISDFGLARIFGGNENEANTTKVVGTYGYIAPEYAMEGLFSVKSDVYSFGVLLLEIVCGRRNSSFRHSHDTSLAAYAWHLWSENRVIELVDPSIQDSSPKNKVLRCIHIGLLCIQDSATHRPDMSSVVLMLESEATSLPLPRLPLFSSMRRLPDKEFNIESVDVSNNMTATMVTGR